MKKAIIVGYTGQDGAYLSQLLTKKKYELFGVSSKSVSKNNYGIKAMDVRGNVPSGRHSAKIKPDEVYFLAAVHQSSVDRPVEDGELFQKSIDLNVKALINF